MKEIKHLDVLQMAKIHAIIMAIFGLIIGILIAIIGSIYGTETNTGVLAGLGFLAIIIIPIFYGIIGFIFGAIGAAIYNLVAKWVGGIKIELK